MVKSRARPLHLARRCSWLASALLPLLIAACGASPLPPERTKAPSAQGPCEIARQQRSMVSTLLGDGKLDRTVRAIRRADELCPETAAQTWAELITTLAELGRAEDVEAVATRISRAADAPAEARSAVDTARRRLAAITRDRPATPAARARRDELMAQADRALAAGRHGEAKQLFLQAWRTAQPAGEALVGAGLAAKALGDAAEGQRLFDRAIDELERQTGERVRVSPPAVYNASAFALSPDDSWLALSYGNRAFLIEPRTWRFRRVLRAPAGHRIRSLTFLGTQTLFAQLDSVVDWQQTGAGTWDLTTGTWTALSLPVGDYVFSADLRTAAVCDTNHVLHGVDVQARTARRLEGSACKNGLAISPQGNVLAGASKQGRVNVWTWPAGELLREHQVRRCAADELVFSADGMLLVAGSDRACVQALHAWNVQTGASTRIPLLAPRDGAEPVGLDPAGNLVLSVGRMKLWDRTGLAIVSLAGGSVGAMEEIRLPEHGYGHAQVGRELAALSPCEYRDREGVCIVDLARNSFVLHPRLDSWHTPHVMWFDSPPAALVTVDQTTWLVLASARQGEVPEPRRLEATCEPGWVAAVSSSGRRLGCAFRRTMAVADTRMGKRVNWKVEEDAGGDVPLAFSPDERLVASAEGSCVVRLRDAATGKELHQLSKPRKGCWADNLSFDKTGNRLAWLAASERFQRVELRDLSDLDSVVSVEIPKAQWVGFSPTEPLLAVYTEKQAQLLDPDSGERLGQVPSTAPGYRCELPMFSPAGELLWTCSEPQKQALLMSWSGPQAERQQTTWPDYAKLEAVLPSGLGKTERAIVTLPAGVEVGWMVGAWEMPDMYRRPWGRSCFDYRGAMKCQDILYGSKRPSPPGDAFFHTNAGYVEFLNRDYSYRAHCRFGTRLFPFDLCRERLYVPGLLLSVLGGSTEYFDLPGAKPAEPAPGGTPP